MKYTIINAKTLTKTLETDSLEDKNDELKKLDEAYLIYPFNAHTPRLSKYRANKLLWFIYIRNEPGFEKGKKFLLELITNFPDLLQNKRDAIGNCLSINISKLK